MTNRQMIAMTNINGKTQYLTNLNTQIVTLNQDKQRARIASEDEWNDVILGMTKSKNPAVANLAYSVWLEQYEK